ncbi:polynucleotide kinase 3'-phosphatase [Cryptococcus depauperatus]
MSKKRASELDGPPAKKAHPFFTLGGTKTLGKYVSSEPSLVHYTHLDPLEAISDVSLPNPIKRIAITFYDLDGTLIKPRWGSKFPKDRHDWVWWHQLVPDKLKQEWQEGRHIVVISNQGDKREKIKSEWRAKLPLIVAKMPEGIPLRVLAALEKNSVYRKPNIGMFETVSKLYKDKGMEIDMDNSIFVGDAAGRPTTASHERDHGDTDYKFALNVGLKFFTPEQHFLDEPRPCFPEIPTGFHPSLLGNLSTLPHIVPSSTPITRKEIEMVVFVGYPASGKSSFYKKHFAPLGYEHVNQDKLKSREKCLSKGEEFIKGGRSIVVDNTNRNRETRSHWVNLARKHNVPIRAFHFLCPPELAKHNNLYRAYYRPPDEPVRTLLPAVAFSTFRSSFEEPNKEEGFDEVKAVNFQFEGSDEQRKKWNMYIE